MKKNRCANCFDCPSCGHNLSTRATGIAVPNPEDPTKTIPQKVFYMACGFCRWTTRDGGIPDQRTSVGAWPEAKSEDTERVGYFPCFVFFPYRRCGVHSLHEIAPLILDVSERSSRTHMHVFNF